MDGRVYNLIARNPDGSIQTVPRVDANDIAGGQPEYQVQLHHAFYRIHGTALIPGGTPTPARPAAVCRTPPSRSAASHTRARAASASPVLPPIC